MLDEVGMTEAQVREMTRRIEPLRIAHRIDPKKMYLYSAVADQVIPAACSDALAEVIAMPDDHHVRLPGNHYTAALFLPRLIGNLAGHMHEE